MIRLSDYREDDGTYRLALLDIVNPRAIAKNAQGAKSGTWWLDSIDGRPVLWCKMAEGKHPNRRHFVRRIDGWDAAERQMTTAAQRAMLVDFRAAWDLHWDAYHALSGE